MKTRGRPPHPEILTLRQQDVLALIRRGLTNDEIAEQLGISSDGVKFHVSEILRRLGVETRHEAAAWQPQPVRTRWAFALAPSALASKLPFAWPVKVIAGAAFVVTAGLVAFLTWGVVATRDDGERLVADTGEPSPVTPSPPLTGIAEVDAAIRVLVAHDIDGVMRLVEFGPIGCSNEQTVGSPPPCRPGQPDGSPIDVFGLHSCEGSYTTTLDGVRNAVENAFSTSGRSSIYAVLRDNSEDRGQDGYYIVETPGAATSSSADVRFWYVTATGKLQYLQSECGPRGAAQQTEYRFPINPEFAYGPKNDCTTGAYGNLLVTVESSSPGGITPQFWGQAMDTREIPTGTRAIVTTGTFTQWRSSVSRVEDVRPGMVLQASGPYDANCVIQAETILAPIPSRTPGARSHYVNPFLGVELDFPSSWLADPNYGGNVGDLWDSYADPEGRDHGYFYITVLNAPSIDYAANVSAHHKLRPFGDAPQISDVSLPAGQAKLILPDPADPSLYTATIILPMRVPIPTLFGDGVYSLIELGADRDHIMQIAESLALTVPVPNPPSPPTATP